MEPMQYGATFRTWACNRGNLFCNIVSVLSNVLSLFSNVVLFATSYVTMSFCVCCCSVTVCLKWHQRSTLHYTTNVQHNKCTTQQCTIGMCDQLTNVHLSLTSVCLSFSPNKAVSLWIVHFALSILDCLFWIVHFGLSIRIVNGLSFMSF